MSKTLTKRQLQEVANVGKRVIGYLELNVRNLPKKECGGVRSERPVPPFQR